MPPVPVHIDAPITPQKSVPATNNETPTSYPLAQPGAAAVPAPSPYTPNPQPQPQPQPTRTTPMPQYSPAAPQPGAVPIPPSQQAAMTASSTLPPPPRPGEAAAQRQASVTSMPQQMSIPPPQQNFAPTHGTMPAAPTSQPTGPTTLNFGAVTAPQIHAGTHPLGYHQNTNAQEMTSAARASLDQQEQRESSTLAPGFGGDNANDTAANVWNTVKGWANTAGTTLADAEKTVWERINKGR